MRAVLTWAAVVAACGVPFAFAATSPLLAWRQPVYIVACFAGVIGLAMLLLQPLLVGGHLPGGTGQRGRRWHAAIGAALAATVVVHVVGLWITSPPDVVDALLFRSPTAFSAWGVIAMWAVFLAALLAVVRRRWRIRLMVWRLLHVVSAGVIVVGTVVHALLIDGTMEPVTKAMLCAVVAVAAFRAILASPSWTVLRRKRA